MQELSIKSSISRENTVYQLPGKHSGRQQHSIYQLSGKLSGRQQPKDNGGILYEATPLESNLNPLITEEKYFVKNTYWNESHEKLQEQFLYTLLHTILLFCFTP